MSRDKISDEERRLIDEAVAAGRVKRIDANDVREAAERLDQQVHNSMADRARRGARRSSAKSRNRKMAAL